jgi:hypothetical protein
MRAPEMGADETSRLIGRRGGKAAVQDEKIEQDKSQTIETTGGE